MDVVPSLVRVRYTHCADAGDIKHVSGMVYRGCSFFVLHWHSARFRSVSMWSSNFPRFNHHQVGFSSNCHRLLWLRQVEDVKTFLEDPDAYAAANPVAAAAPAAGGGEAKKEEKKAMRAELVGREGEK